jgi:predicted nucleotidyltransferase component of viral defense system
MEQTILTPNQQKILLSTTRNQEITNTFYLTGGTALAHYYLQHRFSEDLDFFTDQEFDEMTLQKTVQQLSADVDVEQLEFQSLNGQMIYYFHFIEEVIKVDFAYFPFEHIGRFTMDGTLRVSSIEDIGVNKLHALTSRQRGRDYLDLFEILHTESVLLEGLLKSYRIKFDTYIAPEEWAKNFSNVVDASDQPRFLGEKSWKEVENFFLDEAKTMIAKSIV